jgi:hypothetical protein
LHRDRSKDGYSLLADDNGTIQNCREEDIESKQKYSLSVRDCFSHIVSERNKLKEYFPRTSVDLKLK